MALDREWTSRAEVEAGFGVPRRKRHRRVGSRSVSLLSLSAFGAESRVARTQ